MNAIKALEVIELVKVDEQIVGEMFEAAGWLVLRFWASDIKKDIDGVIAEIMKYLP